MRKALIGFLMAATIAPPLAAQTVETENNEERRGGFARAVRDIAQDEVSQAERREQRSERREARIERRQERAQSPERQAEREARRAARAEAQGQQAQADAPRPRGWVRGVDRTIVEEKRDEAQDRRRREAERYYRGGRWDDRGWGYGGGYHDGGWDRQWRHDRRYDWQRHRYANRGLYRPGRYYSPFSNRGYSRFSIGIQIGSPYYSDRYWIRDPWQYRLPPAYAGTRWVRYYDDVLLVDRYSGQVLDVIHNFFW